MVVGVQCLQLQRDRNASLCIALQRHCDLGDGGCHSGRCLAGNRRLGGVGNRQSPLAGSSKGDVDGSNTFFEGDGGRQGRRRIGASQFRRTGEAGDGHVLGVQGLDLHRDRGAVLHRGRQRHHEVRRGRRGGLAGCDCGRVGGNRQFGAGVVAAGRATLNKERSSSGSINSRRPPPDRNRDDDWLNLLQGFRIWKSFFCIGQFLPAEENILP